MFIKPVRYTDACLWNLTRKCATDQIMIAHAGCWYMCTYYFVRIAHVNYICSIKVEVVELVEKERQRQTDRHRDRQRQTDRQTDRQTEKCLHHILFYSLCESASVTFDRMLDSSFFKSRSSLAFFCFSVTRLKV